MMRMANRSRTTKHGAVLWAFFVCLLGLALLPLQARAEVGVAKTIVRDVYGNSINKRMRSGDGLIAKQRVRTGRNSAAELILNGDSRLSIGPRADIRLDEYVIDAGGIAAGTLNVAKGLLRLAAPKNSVKLTVKTRLATIGIRGTVFDVWSDSEKTEVSTLEGSVEVSSPGGVIIINAGDVVVIRAGKAPQLTPLPSPGLQTAVEQMVALIPASREYASRAGDNVTISNLAVTTARKWLQADKDRNADNLLFLELDSGPVLIAMRPDLAPRHVAKMRELARAGFYDGVEFLNVRHGFAAETGVTDNASSNKQRIPAELTKVEFKRGSVGMKRARGDPDSADGHFFILYRPAQHLTGRYTQWGEVIYGMERIDALRPGQPPKQPNRIDRMWVLSDVLG